MNKIVLYTKTYRGDLERVKHLTESIKMFNTDNIPFYISIPKIDELLFKNNIDTDYVCIVFDEDIIDISTQNWYTQQIVKSSFWELGLCENYVMIDSDSYFIKDFYVSDFMYDENTPYTVMHEQRDLFEWSSKYNEYIGYNPKNGFINDRQRVMDYFNRNGRFYDFGPSPTIWSTKVWKSLDEMINTESKSLKDILNMVASEFTWYGEFLLKYRPIDIIPIEPLFKVFHYQPQYSFYKQLGYTENIFSENYMGIVMQSNWGAPLKY